MSAMTRNMQQLFCAYPMTLAICSTIVQTSNDEYSTSTMKLMQKSTEKLRDVWKEKNESAKLYINILYI